MHDFAKKQKAGVASSAAFAPRLAGVRAILHPPLATQSAGTVIRRQADDKDPHRGQSMMPDMSSFVPGWNLQFPNWGIGKVDNRTSTTYDVNASAGKEGNKVPAKLAPGKWGGSNPIKTAIGGSDVSLDDIDFVHATATTPLNSQTKGVFKIGSHEAVIRSVGSEVRIENFDGYGPTIASFDKPPPAAPPIPMNLFGMP